MSLPRCHPPLGAIICFSPTGQIPPPAALPRHRIGPDSLYSLLGEEKLNNFRASLGDKDVIHVVQFDDPSGVDYCDRTLYMVAFVILTAGW
jgi:hypothetical protein